MSSSAACKWETLVAIFTLVWFLIGMNPYMLVSAACLWETLVAISTLVWLLIGMNLFMHSFISWGWETFFAMLALVWFLFGMNHFMNSFLSWCCETLVAIFTLVWFNFGVNPFMTRLWWTSEKKPCYNIYIGMVSLFVWICSCLVLLLGVEKVLLQYLHWYGFSLVWIRSCVALSPNVLERKSCCNICTGMVYLYL